MEDLILYQKGDEKLDLDFKYKQKYGKVFCGKSNLFVKKGWRWYYFPFNQIETIEMIFGSRQLRQCCGAPIYQNKLLLLTTHSQQHLYLTIEETENGDARKTEELLERIQKDCFKIKVKKR